MQADYGSAGAVVVGVTPANVEDATAFAVEQTVNYPLLANAGDDLAAFGVQSIWGSTIYLIDPQGVIQVEGLDDAESALAEKLSPDAIASGGS